MTDSRRRRDAVRAVLLALVTVTSVMVAGVATTGTVVAQDNDVAGEFVSGDGDLIASVDNQPVGTYQVTDVGEGGDVANETTIVLPDGVFLDDSVIESAPGNLEGVNVTGDLPAESITVDEERRRITVDHGDNVTADSGDSFAIEGLRVDVSAGAAAALDGNIGAEGTQIEIQFATGNESSATSDDVAGLALVRPGVTDDGATTVTAGETDQGDLGLTILTDSAETNVSRTDLVENESNVAVSLPADSGVTFDASRDLAAANDDPSLDYANATVVDDGTTLLIPVDSYDGSDDIPIDNLGFNVSANATDGGTSVSVVPRGEAGGVLAEEIDVSDPQIVVEEGNATPSQPETGLSVQPGTLVPDTVEANTTVEHNLVFNVTNVSADNGTDTVTVTIPEGTSFEEIVSAEVTANGTPVEITGGPTVSDANGGENNSVSFDVNPVSEDDNETTNVSVATIDANFTVAFPNATVEGAPIDATIVDSANGEATATVATVDVVENQSQPDDPDDPDEVATVSFVDQTVSGTNGSVLLVEEATLPEGGFVVLHNATELEDGEVLGSVVGNSDYLQPGRSAALPVTLTEDIAGGEYVAMAHQDTNDNQTYDFVTSEGEDDGPYTDNGTPVVDAANLTVENGNATPSQPETGLSVQPGTLVPDSVPANATVEHNLVFNVTNVSADNGTDTVTVTIPEGTSFEEIVSAEVTANGTPVEITGGPNVSDADGGENNSVSFDVNPVGEDDNETTNVSLATIDANFTVSFPNATVEGAPINATIVDSANGEATATVATVDVGVNDTDPGDPGEPGEPTGLTVQEGTLVPDSVEPNTTVEHNLVFNVTNVSADNGTDTVSVTIPEGTSFEEIVSAEVTANGTPVEITGGPNVSDADGGENNSVSFDVNPVGEDDNETTNVSLATIDANFTVSFPNATVEGAPINATIVDSANGEATATVATVDVGVNDTDPGEPGEVATVTFENKSVAGTNESLVIVEEATLPESGFVVLHNATELADGEVLGSVVGNSEYLQPGRSAVIPVTLTEEIAGGEYVAMAHQDTNDNQVYDFVTSEGEDDGPYTDNGTAVVDAANLTATGEETTSPFDGEIPGLASGPVDTDGDGLYENIDGDGDVDFADVIAFLFALDDIREQGLTVEQRIALNFDGDPGATVDFLDVVALFEQLPS